MTSEEEWNVVQKVLIGDGKYREYRLTQALDTDRAPLWGAGHDVSKVINDIVADRNTELSELRRRITQVENSQSNWIQIGKSVNKSNEKFFLNAVKASKEDIERFEQQNFFSDNSWIRLKNVSELDEDTLEELLDKEGDDVVSAMRIFNNNSKKKDKSSKNKTGHYGWMSRKIDGLTTSQVNGVGERNCVTKVCPSATLSNGCEVTPSNDVTEDNDPMPNIAPPVETSKTVTESVTNTVSKPTNESIDQDLNDTPATQVTDSTEQSVKMDEYSIAIGEKLDEEKEITIGEECKDNGELKEKSTATAECHFDNVDESTAAGEDENQSSPNIGTCSELNDDSRPISSIQLSVVECHQKEDNSQNDAEAEKVNAPTKSVSQDTKRFADPSGYSRLRLSSSSSSANSLSIASDASPKVTDNIWEQKAQKRKDAEEQRKLEKQKEVIEAQGVARKDNVNLEKRDGTAQTISTTTSFPVRYSGEKKHQKKENQKPADKNNGWITFSSKKNTRPSIGLLENTKSNFSQQPSQELNNTAAENEKEGKSVLEDKKQNASKSGEPIQENKEEPIEQTNEDSSKAEKRAKYRQRHHEKIKSKAREEGEKRKKNHDLKIEAEKKKKAWKHDLEFQRKQLEMEKLRKERERQNNKSSESDKQARIILETKERLEDHVKERILAYQVIGSKLFVDKRLPELKNKEKSDLNSIKYKILDTFQQRQVEMEKMSMFLTFASHHLKESNKFKIKDILEYMTSCCVHEERTTPLQEEIHKDSNEFYKENKFNSADALIQASLFAESVIKRTKAMTDRSEDVEYVEKILTDYKNQHNDVVEFIGITSYLRTRMNLDLFVVEEDYLVMSVDKENSGYLEEADAESDDDDEYEKPEVQDMSCQTDGEPYDVRAASFMPREEE